MDSYALNLEKIKKSFYGTEVLHGIDLCIKKGEVHGIVGENGAGKSTLMNVIGGVFGPDSGSMYVNGNSYTPATPKDAQQAGIAFVHQELNLFSNMTVSENLFLEHLPKGRLKNVKYQQMNRETEKYLKTFHIHVNPRTKVEELSMGVRQSIEIAKALIINAQIIIFDEPTTSLSQVEKENLFQVIEELKSKGVTIIYISHILEDIFRLCDRISVLRDGKIISTMRSEETTQNDLITQMVGRKMEKVYPTVEKSIGEAIFQCRNISAGTMVKDANFTLHKGEILGFFGLMGAGRTELMRVIFGVDKCESGHMTYKGKDFQPRTPKEAMESGWAFVTENRRDEGLLMPKSIEENLLLVHLPRLKKKFSVVDDRKGDVLSEEYIQKLHIKVQNKSTQLARSLSGGNQQKVVLGKWIMNEPDVLILDEPTKGVDVGAKYEIYTIIQDMAQKGAGILVVSSEMEELMGICDRIVVMSEGRVTGCLDKNEFVQSVIMKKALEGGAEH